MGEAELVAETAALTAEIVELGKEAEAGAGAEEEEAVPIAGQPVDATALAAEAFEVAAKEGYAFLFTVVIAAYNAQDYLAEAIESVVGQSIGFAFTQIIVVDDGSVDGTAQVARDFAQRYPDNVLLLTQENRGVSAARNAGLAMARGKFVNFLDSDDRWSSNAFACALEFFRDNPDVKMAASRFVYFGAREGGHRLNYKFKETRVIDVLQERDCPQLSSSTCFFRSDALEGRSFCEQLKVSEDARLVNEILLDELRYGVMAAPVYYYRQHDNGDSAVAGMKKHRSWYFEGLALFSEYLMQLSRKKYGNVLPFIQHTIMYDLQWRIRAKMPDFLSSGELMAYRNSLVSLLREIEDPIISEQRTISIDYVAYAFALKYGLPYRAIVDNATIDDGWLAFRVPDATDFHEGSSEEARGAADESECVLKLRPLDALSDALVLRHLIMDGNTCVFEGIIATYRFNLSDVKLEITANNRPVPIQLEADTVKRFVNPFNDEAPHKVEFTCAIALDQGEEVALRASMSLFGKVSRQMRFAFDEELGFPENAREGERCFIDGWLLRVIDPFALSVRRVGVTQDYVGSDMPSNVEQYGQLGLGAGEIQFPKAPWTDGVSNRGNR